MKLSDFKGLFKSSQPTVTSVSNPHGDYYEVRLSIPAGVIWKPGQHAMFTIKGPKMTGGNMRPLSIASTMAEGEILLGTRTGQNPSDFKKALINLKAGDCLDMRGPFGPFYVQDDSSPLVLFASGVGITPIRAVITSLQGVTNRPIELVYAAADFYLYGDELNHLAKNQANLKLHQVTSPEQAQAKLRQLATSYGNQAHYYISGAPSVIKSIQNLLAEQGISKKRLVADSFNGY